MKQEKASWQEEDSALYARLADVAVPARAEQIATLLTLIPFGQEERFRAVEVGSGEGTLARALLEFFPVAEMLALDGSASMRDKTAARLAQFGSRATVEPFDLLQPEWYSKLDGADVVVSSLAVHHLDGAGKRDFFDAAYHRLAENGALLIADLVQPGRSAVNYLFGGSWDWTTRRQSRELFESDEPFSLFQDEHWNIFWYPDPEIDKPSTLFDQLLWMRESGFQVVDCFWMQAGHAIYGGYKQSGFEDTSTLTFEDALRAASAALGRDEPAGNG